jgi:hypothetical protein
MTDNNKTMTSHVGMGGAHTCDREECGHFETKSMTDYNKHLASHKVLSGHARCAQCGEFVVYQDLEEKDRPTMQQIANKLVFHPQCSETFFKDKGFEVKKT